MSRWSSDIGPCRLRLECKPCLLLKTKFLLKTKNINNDFFIYSKCRNNVTFLNSYIKC